MTSFPYEIAEDPRLRLGLIALQVDETIEEDFRQMFPQPAARLHISRVPSGAELTPDTIAAMEEDLPQAARLLPPAARFEVIAYGCTSGTSLIGAGRVRELVRANATTHAVSDPLSAAIAALRALNMTRVGIVSPYIASVAAPIRAGFEAADLVVPDMLGFGEEIEARVARIAPASICAAARALASRAELDAIFLSCTNLRTLEVIPTLEAELDLPVLSSNQVLGWHMASLAGLALRDLAVPGQLGKQAAQL
ncbi:aspartate/glutamate racemase family protein [Tritonibacter mobilis]|uniref:maleate cis-trans isomerase family protein n=1 Tax=Tritonibacter mobilis TaxID=379347 RepID=UPI0001B8B197|nr:aspartate/glutamate racemase family protein [Tritonibacter mobilis]EEW58786.1 Asp/Glu racemase [Ruegeria sp. TrichCH4B]GLP86944.1 maleate cis-trans isomerase [Tritonibacter mobilis]SDW54823.1 maleate isomerase [Tritonibacter mobilis]